MYDQVSLTKRPSLFDLALFAVIALNEWLLDLGRFFAGILSS